MHASPHFFQEIQMKYMSSCFQVALLGKEFSDLLRQDNFDYSVKKVVFFRSALYFFVKNKRLDKRHMRNKWGHISFEVQNQCVLKVVLEAVLWLLVYLHK